MTWDHYTERVLESAILVELQRFITELGNDFAFLDRQKRITIDGEDYYIDLLRLGEGNIRVAEYLTKLFGMEVLEEKLRLSIECARRRLEASEG